MISKKFAHFEQVMKDHIKPLKNLKGKVTEEEFDAFTETVIGDSSLDVDGKIYCRDGFVFIKPVNNSTFQLICFQINSFGAGIFDKGIKKLCTPILLTVTMHGKHRYLNHSLKDSCISVDEFYLGKYYTGSKGPLCKRDEFNEYAKKLFISNSHGQSFGHHTVYELMTTNLLCHHIAEVMGYAFGALDFHFMRDKEVFHMSSCSAFNENKDKLYLDIIDDFSGERMSGNFQVPHYAKLKGDVKKFHEEFDTLTWEVNFKKDTETFLLPIGYQKVHEKKFHKNVNVITSQHIIESVLADYYQRRNAFVVSNTFQTLEYLSRAFIAKVEGRDQEFTDFMRSETSCLGYYPERNFEEIYEQREEKFSSFDSEFAHSMFFRSPVLR